MGYGTNHVIYQKDVRKQCVIAIIVEFYPLVLIVDMLVKCKVIGLAVSTNKETQIALLIVVFGMLPVWRLDVLPISVIV